MSFILDALKKSDKKRQDGAVPNLVTSHEAETDSKQHRSLWPLLLVLLLTVNAAILLWWFGPWSPPDLSPLPQAESINSVEQKMPQKPVAPEEVKGSLPAAVSESLPEPIDENPQPVPEAVAEEPPLVETVAEPVGQNESIPQQEQEPPAAAGNVAETPAAPVPASAVEQAPPVYALSDLPPSVRRDIPEMHIAMHAYYQDAQQRLVSINNKLLREGRLLDGKYLLEEITVDGVIFHYAGYRFQVLFKGSRL